jgi:hypothetical protein
MSESEEAESEPEDDSSVGEVTATYHGIEVNHKDADGSPEMYAISSTTNELVQWAEVPRANADFMDGYQRQLDEGRLDSIRQFLETPENTIPGAILVTVDEDHLDISQQEGGGVDISIKSTAHEDTKPKLKDAYEHLYSRLSDEGQTYVDSLTFDDEETDEAETSDDGETGEAETGDGEEDSSDADTDVTVSYLARKTGELKKSLEEFDELPDEERESLEEYVDRVSKPGFIIDGQHRVFGGKKYPGDIEYPIVLIPGLEDKEQVYHFYMINDKAKPISQDELFITVATALSEVESKSLVDRLAIAGVDVNKARFPYLADVEEESPFHQMIDYSEKVGEETGVFPFGDVYTIMDRFVGMKGVNNVLYSNVDDWEDDDIEFKIQKFYLFWETLQDHYEDLWNDAVSVRKGEEEFDEKDPEQFFRPDTMRVFQDYILDELANKQENRDEFLQEAEEELGDSIDDLWRYVLESDETFQKQIEEVINDIPPEFFRWKWNTSGLSTSENRQNLREELEGAADTNLQGLSNFRIFNKGF